MKTFFSTAGDFDAFVALITDADRTGFGTLLVLACDANEWPAERMTKVLNGLQTPAYGGIFPQIAVRDRSHEQGVLIIGLNEACDTAVISGMSDTEADFEDQIVTQVENWENPEDCGTLLVLVDGLSSRISALVQDLFLTFGLDNNFIGGGTGSLSFVKKPCIMTPKGLLADAAIVIKIPRVSVIGVTHGWTSIGDVMEVTEADRNIVKSLNWQPAFEVYKQTVDSHSPQAIEKETFFDVAKSYPLGLDKLEAELIVRDPLMSTEEGHLVCVGEVPRGALIRILNGTSDTLIRAAQDARDRIEQTAAGMSGDLILFDCISRVLFLGTDIEQEISAVSRGEPVFGAFTLGEIANNGRDYLEFLNKTTVLARLGRSAQS